MGHHLSMTILTMAPLAHPEDVGVGVVEDVAISVMDPLEEDFLMVPHLEEVPEAMTDLAAVVNPLSVSIEIIGIPHGIEEVEEAEAAEEALEAAEVSATKASEAAIVGVALGLVAIGRHPLAAR